MPTYFRFEHSHPITREERIEHCARHGLKSPLTFAERKARRVAMRSKEKETR